MTYAELALEHLECWRGIHCQIWPLEEQVCTSTIPEWQLLKTSFSASPLAIQELILPAPSHL